MEPYFALMLWGSIIGLVSLTVVVVNFLGVFKKTTITAFSDSGRSFFATHIIAGVISSIAWFVAAAGLLWWIGANLLGKS